MTHDLITRDDALHSHDQGTPATSMVLHIPHSSMSIPADLRASIVLSDDALRQELIAMTDSYTAELFDFASDVPRELFPVSRLIVDPERFIDDTREPMAARGMGVIYTATSDGAVLRLAPTSAERVSLLAAYYNPHHDALTRAVEAALRAFESCVIIDCHSFPSNPRAYELDQSADRPEICVGTDDFHTPDWLVDLCVHAFRDEGYSVAINSPYAGTLVPSAHFRADKRVVSIMIEINRRVYMDEVSGERLASFMTHQRAVHSCLSAIRRGLVGSREGDGASNTDRRHTS